MPEIFSKDSKLKIIEYGSDESMSDILNDMKDGVLSLFSK